MSKLEKENSKPKNPVSAFKLCPRCGSANLMQMEEDLSCTYCGWDSIALRIECQE